MYKMTDKGYEELNDDGGTFVEDFLIGLKTYFLRRNFMIYI